MSSKMKKSWNFKILTSYAMKSGFYKLAVKEKNPIKTLKPVFNHFFYRHNAHMT